MSIVSNTLKRIKPSPTIAVTSKARELRAAGKGCYRSWGWRA